MKFVYHELFDSARPAKLPGYGDFSADVVDAVLEEAGKLCERGAVSAQPLRRRGRLSLRERRGAHAQRVQGSLPAVPSRAAGPASPPIPTTAARACRNAVELDGRGDDLLGQPGLRHVSGPDATAPTTRSQRTAPTSRRQLYLPKLVDGTLDRHDVPDRAAMRHRPRPDRAPRPSRRPTAATRSPAPRSSSPPASTT